MDNELKEHYLHILREELVEAMGCTEPIALAYAGAVARQHLGQIPYKALAECSGNMLKNVRCVIIPNSGGMEGIEAAVLLGAVGGDPGAEMDVLQNVTEEHRAKVAKLCSAGCCRVEYLETPIPLHIIVTLWHGEDCVKVEIRHTHINVVNIEKNGEVILHKEDDAPCCNAVYDRSVLNIRGIIDFSNTVALEDLRPIIEPQVRCNMDIAYEGMSGNYGVGIGRLFRECYADGVITRIKAYTSAASEARMGGCDKPVVINSGSGNQGITASVPIIIYARENDIPSEKLYRALAFSNLMTIYQKEYIGRLSAFCGAVSAACASGAALTYLCGGTEQNIIDTVENTLANIPGIFCDGAKVSCAAKIATCLDAAVMSHLMAMRGKVYGAYTGILRGDVGETITSVGYLGRVGMVETDREIIKLMVTK